MARNLLFGVFSAALFLIAGVAYSQISSGGTTVSPPTTQAPSPSVPSGQVQSPPDFPEYIVTPREDLNPYGYSTLDSSSGNRDRDGAGTLGTKTKRRSNLEVNKPRMKDEKKEEKEEQLKESEQERLDFSATPSGQSTPSGTEYSPSPSKSGDVYTWTDKKGVVHVTNDLGSVPVKYQKQIIEESKKVKEFE